MPQGKAVIGLMLKFTDNASPGLDKAGQKLDALGGKMEKTGQKIRNAGLALTGAGAAGLLMSKAITDAAAKVETAMANVNTMLGDGEDAYNDYNKAVNDLITSIPVLGGKVEALNGLYQVLSAGIEHGAKAMEVLNVAAKAAAAGVTTLSVSVDAITGILNAYKSTGISATEAADLLFTSVLRGKLTFEELAGSIGPVIAIAAQVGVGFEQIAAAMATLTKGSVPVDIAATSLKAVMTAFLRPTQAMKDEVLKNAAAWGVMTPEIRRAKRELEEAEGAVGEAAARVDELKLALEGAAPVPAGLTNEMIKAKEALAASKEEFDRHSSALRLMEAGYNLAAGAMKGLSDEMAGISIDEKKNRLEIMKIRQAADDASRAMTDKEKARIKELEEANDRLSIKSTELGIKQDELRLKQSARREEMDKEKAKMEEVNGTMLGQTDAIDEIQGEIDEWTATWQSATEAQLEAAKVQKTAAEESAASWSEALGQSATDAVLLTLETYGLVGAIDLFSQAVEGNKGKLTEMFPNIRALTAILPLTGEMAEEAAKDLDAMADSSGSANEAFQKQADTTANKLEKLNARLEIATETMAEGTTPAMMKMKEVQVKVAEGFASADKAVGGAMGAMLTYGSATLAAIGPLISIIGQMMMLKAARLAAAAAKGVETTADAAGATVKTASTAATTANTTSIWANTMALLANPMTWIVILIIALIAALYLLWKNWDQVTEAVDKFGKSAKENLGRFFDWAKGGLEKLGKGVVAAGDAFRKFSEERGKEAVETWGKVRDTFAKGGEFLKDNAIETAKTLIKHQKKMAEGMVEGVETAFDGLGDFFGGLYDKFLKWGENMIEAFKKGIDKKKDEVKDGISEVADTIKDFLGVESPAEEGALKDVEKWPRNLVDTYGKNLLGELPMLERRMGELTKGMRLPGATPVGGARTTYADTRLDNRRTTIELHQHITNIEPETIADMVKQVIADALEGG